MRFTIYFLRIGLLPELKVFLSDFNSGKKKIKFDQFEKEIKKGDRRSP